MARLTVWGWFWLAWACTGAAVECYWLAANAANTLSRQIWGIERLNLAHPLDLGYWTWEHWSLAVTLWIFFGWLSVHFPFGYLR